MILIYIIFFKDEGWNNVEMVYDGKALTARIRSVSPDGTGVEEKDTKILSGIGKNTNISSIIRYGKKNTKLDISSNLIQVYYKALVSLVF